MSEARTYKKKPYINFYKPLQKENAGAALQFSYDAGKQAIFLEATSQKGAKLPQGDKAQFDWANKLVFKLGTADMGKLLLLFNGRVPNVKLLHSSQDKMRISVFEITRGEYNGAPNFALTLARTIKGGGEDAGSRYVQMYLNQDELALLAHFMRDGLTRMFGFDNQTEE
jgi:hypothetical protein